MTDRFHSLTVVLDHDIRDDDAKKLIDAIKQFRGVIKVTGVVADPTSMMAEARARTKIGDQILKIVYPDMK